MTTADVIMEYRQIRAADYERENGKPYEETATDDSYADYQRSLGVNVDG